jgi:hypothetical protein
MSFPTIVSHDNDKISNWRSRLEKDEDFLSIVQVESTAEALKKLVNGLSKVVETNLTNVHTYYKGMRVTLKATNPEESVIIISAIIYNSLLDRLSIPCYIPLGQDSDPSFVLLVDIHDLENPIFNGYVDLTKNPIYNLVKDMDSHFQIHPVDILTDWDSFAALFA